LTVEIEIEAFVNPTEDPDKVEKAIRNIFGEVALERRIMEDGLILRANLEGLENLGNMREMLRRERVRDAARAHMMSRIEGGILRFGINRQAAYMNRVSFYHPREAPLGPIQVTIRGDLIQAIEYLTGKESNNATSKRGLRL
jgi:predicted RNA binding protein with dsRBD fold (UPF0201 family)